MKVKICGITRAADAQHAALAGADAIGLNFWPGSKRFVTVKQARSIVRGLPPLVWVVGVFVNAPREEIEATVRAVGLHAVQLHGDESARDTRGHAVPVFKALHLAPSAQPSLEEKAAARANFKALHPGPRVRFTVPLVLDAQQPGYGGGGVRFDWKRARRLAAGHPVLLAGGLTPRNVREAIAAVRPWGVDVASGVESSPGLKDKSLVTRFIRNARSTS
jgi:phosphoribosylanthranilate isomerase